MKPAYIAIFTVPLLLVGSGTVRADSSNLKNLPVAKKLYGIPKDPNVIDFKNPDAIQMNFVMNDQKTRVGILFQACVNPAEGSEKKCQDMVFYFPELKFDAEKSEILLKGEPVAHYGAAPESTVFNKPFAFGYEIESKVVDNGFDKHARDKVRVYVGKEVTATAHNPKKD